MQAAHRLPWIRFDKETERIDQQGIVKEGFEGFQQGDVDPILAFAVGHAHGEGKMKAELFKDVWIPPEFQVFLLLAAEWFRFSSGQLTGIERGAKPIKGAGTE